MAKITSGLILFALLASRVLAGSPAFSPAVDPAVQEVSTGGWWEIGDLRGFYRVLVASIGSEEPCSYIRFDWVSAPGGEDSPGKVIHSVVFYDSLLGTAKVQSLNPVRGSEKVILSGTLNDGENYSCELLLKPNGTYSLGTGKCEKLKPRA